ncbi:MAG: hypothetical protein J5518_06065 [Lachnospiraceae bacterium]|nr:hypothetical protein [Lachnospiraceae bacterium]
MYKRIIALVMVTSLSIAATRTAYAAEEIEAVEIREESQGGSAAPSGSASSDPAPSNPEPAPVQIAESAPVPAPAAAAESVANAQVIITELDVSRDVLPYLDEATVYIGGGTLPVTPEAPAAEPANPAPVVTEPASPAPAAPVAEDTDSPDDGQEADAGQEAETEKEIAGAVSDLEKAQEILDEVEEPDTTELEKALDETDKELNKFKDKETETKEAAKTAKESAEAANSAGTKKEAVEEKERAGNALAVAETHLMEATDAYDEARKNANAAEEAYEQALIEHEKAQQKIEEAKKALESAKTNSTAALEALKKAQENAAKAEERVRKLRDNKEDLENIKDQYYASMVYYYRNLLGRAAEYQEDGTLDLEANAVKVQETGKAEKEALNPDKNNMQLNRYLAKLLIDYMISNDENVDPETANLQIGVKEAGLEAQRASEGTVFTNAEGVDQTVVTGRKKDIDGNYVYAGEQTDIYMERSKQQDNGRTNKIKVTYTDKDGVEHVEYYNYIYKTKKYEDGLDIENGPIYLALVRYNEESGKWEASEVDDENNFDDYSELTKALQAIEDLEKYEQARMAVDDAVEKVAQLEEMIANLSLESPSNLNVLEEALAEAREELDEAYEKKRELEDVVEEARKAVAGIDLSRFKIHRVDPEEDLTPSGGTYTAAATEGLTAADLTPVTGDAITTSIPSMPVAFLPLDPVVTPAAGLLAESPFMDITLASTERALQAEAENNLLALRFAQLPEAVTPDEDSVNLGEKELPGAKAVVGDEEKNRGWWMWILIALASLTGWNILKKYQKQQEPEEQKNA